MSVDDWSDIADNNVSIDGINIAEGCLPGNVNNAIRAVMAGVKAKTDDIEGDISTLDNNTVKLTGNQTINGVKTFNDGLKGVLTGSLIGNASSATNATNATNAVNATNAGYANTAGTANYANNAGGGLATLVNSKLSASDLAIVSASAGQAAKMPTSGSRWMFFGLVWASDGHYASGHYGTANAGATVYQQPGMLAAYICVRQA